MPELPEVETVVRILNSFVPNKTISDIVVYRDKNIGIPVREFKESLIGEAFLNVTRVGKHIVFHLTNNKVIVSHLRMEGKYFESRVDEPRNKHDILSYHFADGTALRFNDTRKFGTIDLRTEYDHLITPPLSKVGKEPWDINDIELHDSLRERKGTIKEALLDQSLMCGLGNIYVDEVLFASSIHPKTLAKDISLNEAKTLIEEARRILECAIECGGSTIRSYHPKEGMDGRMQNELLVYGHMNEPCSRCGMTLRKIEVSGRGTTYCPHCQKRKGHPFIIGVTGPVGAGKSTVTKYFKNKGYKVIDADKIVHELYEKPEVVKEIENVFGDSVVMDGRISRKTLLNVVNDDKDKKEALERVVHSYVYKEIFNQFEKHKKIILDVPLLIGGPLENECDLIIYVDALESVRAERIAKRGKDVKKTLLLNKGWPKARAKLVSGIALDGSGSLEELQKQLDSKAKML